jgi:hypothetical protein
MQALWFGRGRANDFRNNFIETSCSTLPFFPCCHGMVLKEKG